MKKNYAVLLLALYFHFFGAFSETSFMTYRSQGCNLARNNSGWLHRCTDNNTSVAVEYTHSFDANAISDYFFGCRELTFSGSRVPQRGACDILADYFGLPTDYQGTLSFSPSIQNVIADFDFYFPFGCNNQFNGRLTVPLVYTKWALYPCERTITPGTLDYPAGYMSKDIITRSELEQGPLAVLSGTSTFGDLSLPLQYGRICSHEQILTKFSDVFVALGYAVCCDEEKRLNLDVNVTIPTGTLADATFLFSPQIGNGYHWALGIGLSTNYQLISSNCATCSLSVYLDATIQHLFKSTQKRSYDLTENGPGSRYILLMDMIKMVSNTQGFSPIPGQDLIDRQYITRLLYVADATTLDSKIKIDVQADIVAKLGMTYHCWDFELGYNFWGRSAEKLICREPLKHKYYGVKGDAQVYGFLDIGAGAVPLVVEVDPTLIPLPLNATQSHATIHAGQGAGNTTNNFINSNADNAALMYNVGFPIAQTSAASLVNTGVTSLAQVNGSNQAITLTDVDINNCSGLSPRSLSHTLFGSIRYEFQTCHQPQPYLLLGAQGEFAGSTHGKKTAISQWGIWLKCGVNY